MKVFVRFLAALAASLAFASGAWAAAACNANEDVVSFNFGLTNTTSATGGTGSWPTGVVAARAYPVGTGATANTITFTPSIDVNFAWSAPASASGTAPVMSTYGNMPNALAIAMDGANNTGNTAFGTHLTLNFNRPMNKVQFVMGDVDYQQGDWRDVLQATGFLNGAAVVAPTFTFVTPGDYAFTQPGGGVSRAVANTGNGAPNCGANSAACNITVDFPNPIDSLRIDFFPGQGITNPASQIVAFQNFSYCVPKRDLYLVKNTTSAPFAVGGTGTYTLTITNDGGNATLPGTPVQVRDILGSNQLQFPAQSPAGWTCTISTTTNANDTANCSFGTNTIAAGASTVLTLTVAISAAATSGTVVPNQAKVFGGGDPNKAAVGTTGAVTGCTAANEGWQGGGAQYASGTSTFAGCGFESTLLTRQAQLSVTKTNGANSQVAGSTTSYIITVVNSGPGPAAGTVVRDPGQAGLNCTTATFATTPAGGTVSPALTIGALQSTGVSITPTFAANSTATFTLTCGVTATGQ